MIQIPSNTKQFVQTNASDILGNLYSTKGIDLLGNKGKIRLARRLILNTSTDDVSSLNSYPVGFRFFNNGVTSSFYTIAGTGGAGYVFSALAIDANFGKVTTTGAPTALDSTTSDIETAFGELYASSASDGKVYYLNGSNTWANLSAGSSGFASMLCFFPAQQRMYCTKNGNQIQSWDSTHTVASPGSAYALSLANGEIITWIRAASDRLFIGTVNQAGGKANVYEWDGVSTQYQKLHRMKASGALACVVDEDIPYIFDSNGALNKWNGGAFVRLTGIWRRKLKPLFSPFSSVNNRFVHPNGMSIVNGKINVLLDLTNYDAASHGGTQEDCNPSGVWEYDGEIAWMNPESGTNTLYCKHLITLTHASDTITDYGQGRIYGAGALAEILTAQSPVTTNGTLLVGCSYYSDMASPTIKSGIFYEDTKDTLTKAGSIVTSKFIASSSGEALTDIFNKIYLMHEYFLNTGDRTVWKYRMKEDTPIEGNITFTSTTTFTTTLDISTIVDGDEIEIISGFGANICVHIDGTPTLSSGTYTVTLEEAISGASSQVSRARFSKWRKAGQIDDSENNGSAPLGGSDSIYCQIKGWFQWTGANEIFTAIVDNAEDMNIGGN